MGADARGWHVELYDTEWVIWWYGPLAEGGTGHIAPACVRIDFGGAIGVMEFPFELPDPKDTPNLQAPVEIRRERAVGWRARTNNLVHDCGWNLAKDEATARTESSNFVKLHRLPGAIDDVRTRTAP